MRTRTRHVLSQDTLESLRSAKSGISLRKLAAGLGYPASYAATLSDVLRDKPGKLSAAGEDDLRKRLGLPSMGTAVLLQPGQHVVTPEQRTRRRYVRPCLSPDPHERLEQLKRMVTELETLT